MSRESGIKAEPEVTLAEIVVVNIVAPHGKKYCLKSASGRVWYPYKTLKECIHGKVKAAVELREIPGSTEIFELTETYVAIKLIYKKGEYAGRPIASAMFGDHAENPVTETAYQQFLSNPGHRYVTRIIEACQNEEAMFVVIEYCNQGELFDVVQGRGQLGEDLARRFFLQIVLGTRYIHSRGLVHRDMSLENVMLHDGEARIIDFGMATPIPPDGLMRGFRGKVYYIAPEVVYHRQLGPYVGTRTDVWALGPMLHIMLVGAPPWEKAWVQDQRFVRAIHGQLRLTLTEWGVAQSLSDDAIDIMQSIMQARLDLLVNEETGERCIFGITNARPSLEDIIRHPWLRPVRSLVPAELQAVLFAPFASLDEIVSSLNVCVTRGALGAVVERLPAPVDDALRSSFELVADRFWPRGDATTDNRAQARVLELLRTLTTCLADDTAYATWCTDRAMESKSGQGAQAEGLFEDVDPDARGVRLTRWLCWLAQQPSL
jgi:serine/threonine protein kinase